jgi:hypothetical protein
MHQTKKGNQCFFGMKAPIGVDSRTKLIHSVVATRPMCMTVESFPSSFTGARPLSGGTRRTPGRGRSSAGMRRGRRT